MLDSCRSSERVPLFLWKVLRSDSQSMISCYVKLSKKISRDLTPLKAKMIRQLLSWHELRAVATWRNSDSHVASSQKLLDFEDIFETFSNNCFLFQQLVMD